MEHIPCNVRCGIPKIWVFDDGGYVALHMSCTLKRHQPKPKFANYDIWKLFPYNWDPFNFDTDTDPTQNPT